MVEPLDRPGGALRHVTIMQGGKAYGVHIHPQIAVPARERWPRDPHENFYWLQEDFLRERQAKARGTSPSCARASCSATRRAAT